MCAFPRQEPQKITQGRGYVEATFKIRISPLALILVICCVCLTNVTVNLKSGRKAKVLVCFVNPPMIST